MKLFSIIFFILFCSQLYAQEYSKGYSFHKNVYDYSIQLSNQNEFTLRLTNIQDPDWGILLSFGKVTKNGNTLILTDMLTQSRMVVDTSNNKLKIKNSFYFCENQTSDLLLDYTGSLKEEFEDYVKDKSYMSLILARYKHNETNPLYELPYGTYNSAGVVYFFDIGSRPGFHLYLVEPHKYSLAIGDIIISKGIFTRNKNILLLYDTSMDHVYHLLIEKDGLKSMMMPGDVEGVSLRQGDVPYEKYKRH